MSQLRTTTNNPLAWLFRRKDTFALETGRLNRTHPTAFLHFPKSAGTSFRVSLCGALGAKFAVEGFDHSIFGDFTQFDTIGDQFKSLIFGPSDLMPSSPCFVSGHFAASTLKKNYPRANFCTVLREPISRILSFWLFWRQFNDEEAIGPWGPIWGERMCRARRPIVDFLRDPELACLTDNLFVRMLLWPDPRIPRRGFISPQQAPALVADALAELQRFNFVDYVENPDFVRNVEEWIIAPFALQRLNETRSAHPQFPVILDSELTAEANALLGQNSRMDFELWGKIVKARSPKADIRSLQARTLRENIAHFRAVQSG
ncbi:hypothetical protein ABLE91_20185 [Aquabacter sp. CN5-332]|uniref:hypothetical protein n=1 Tax=Aquabacter sp. CN5-332 TaxID=3156608 RepID=UPI0032B5E2BC